MSTDGTLHRYFLGNGDKRCHKWVHYLDIYERHFARFRGKSPTVIEIGVHGGGSLDMWKFYFGPGSKIVGIDINPKCKQWEKDGVEIFIGSQDDPALIDRVFEAHPHVDILIDDGSHRSNHMIATFNMAYSQISPHGVYLVEDTYTSYMAMFDGGVKHEGTFMEFVKDKVDELNAIHPRREFPITDFTRSTAGICCYDSVVVFERGPQGLRQGIITKKMGGRLGLAGKEEEQDA